MTFGRTRGTGVEGQYNLVYEYRQRDVGLDAGRLAIRLLMHLLPDALKAQTDYEYDADFDFPAELKSFVLSAQRKEFGPFGVVGGHAGRQVGEVGRPLLEHPRVLRVVALKMRWV